MRTLMLAAAAASLLALAGAAQAQMPSPADAVKAMDKNGDNAISKDEWGAAGRRAERFDLIDANKDGKISAAELEAAMAAMRRQNGG